MKKRLYKSETNKILTGTCGGLGEYFNIDPTIVRLIFVIGTFFSGFGVLVYIVAALIMPSVPADDFEKMNKDFHFKKSDDSSGGTTDEEFDSYFKK